MTYALADVTHLRVIYEHLSAELDRTGRRAWVEEELATLTDPEIYVVEPEEAWRRIKTRTNSGRFLAAVKELAEFRERYARDRNVPRSRVFKDDALLEIASTKPKDMNELGRSRLLLREARRGDIADGIFAALQRARDYGPDDYPEVDHSRDKLQINAPLADLLRVLLKAKSEKAGVAQKLIASAADLDAISAGERDVHALKGWRRKVFGEDALRLCGGEIALAARNGSIEAIDLG
jgi:ribonuclease D